MMEQLQFVKYIQDRTDTRMAAKRKLEFEDYSQVTEEAGSADIHGVVTSVSPLKKSKKGNNYYHGQLCDGKQSLRFVGFASNHQKMLEEFLEGRKSVEIRNCQIKKSNRDSDKLEVLVKGATKICPSEKKFDVSKMEFQQNESVEIMLEKVDEIEPFTRININVNVIKCGEPITLGTRQKQEVTVSDATGLGTVQLWENNIGILEEGQSYRLMNFRVVEYENVKYIAMCWSGSEFQTIEHVESEVDGKLNAEEESITLHNPKIAAEFKLEKFFKCLRCGSRTEPAEGSEVRCCNRECSILNESSFCDTFSSAEVLVVEGRNKVCLTAFGEMIAELLGSNDVAPTEEGLLRCPPILEMKYRNNEILKVVRN